MRRQVWAILLLVAGCAETAPPADSPQAPEPTRTTRPEPAEPPATPEPAPDPKPEPAATPVHGKLAGEPFEPAVTFSGNKLFFKGAPGGPDRTVTVTLPRADWSGTVKPDQPAGPELPQVEVTTQLADKSLETAQFVNGYTLTLSLSAEDELTRAGTIDLALPDEKKSTLQGTFTATPAPRDVLDRPTAIDRPFVEGKVTLPAGPEAVTVVAVAAQESGLVFEQVTGPQEKAEPGQVLAAAIEANPPRKAQYVRTAETGDRYEFTRLPPGRYLVVARVQPDGPATWGYHTLKADGQLDLPLAPDPTTQGQVEVTLPEGHEGTVQLLPADTEPGGLVIPDVALAAALKYEQPARPTVTFEAIAPGTYRVVAKGRQGTVTVAAKQTAKVSLR